MPAIALLERDIKRGIRGGSRRLAVGLASHIKDASDEVLQGARHGRRYKIRGGWHTASAPEEAPALLSGQLRRNVRVIGGVFPHADDVSITAELHYSQPYAAILHARRPQWFPLVFAKARPAIDRELDAGVLAAGGFR